MKTWIIEERIFEIEPFQNITTFELAIMMKKGFHPSFWMLDTDANDHTIRTMMALPRQILRHFTVTTYKVEYKTRWWWLPNMDEEISRETIKTEGLVD